MACYNPFGDGTGQNYYDGSDGCSSGSSTDTKDFVKKSEVKNYDGVVPFADDTKNKDAIYIKTDGSLWTWNGTTYISSSSGEDKINITINRTNETVDIAPKTSELHGITPKKDTFAMVYLTSGFIELWKFGTSWAKYSTINRRPVVRSIRDTNQTKNVSPTASQFITPINGDVLVKQHIDANRKNVTFVERFIRNGGAWNRSSLYYNNSPRTILIDPATTYTVAVNNNSTHHIIDAGVNDMVVSLPPVATSKDNILTFTAKTLASGKKIQVSTIYALTKAKESVSIISDGTNWHIVSSVHEKPTLEGTEVTILRADEATSNRPTATEFGRPSRAGDIAVIHLGNSGVIERWTNNGTVWSRVTVITSRVTVLIQDNSDNDLVINLKDRSVIQDKGSSIIYKIRVPTGKQIATVTSTVGKIHSKRDNLVSVTIPELWASSVVVVKLTFEDTPSSASTLNHVPQFSDILGHLKDSELEIIDNDTLKTEGLYTVTKLGYTISYGCGANKKNGNFTGSIVIALPTSMDNMLGMEIKISEYMNGKSGTLFISGHYPNNTIWDTCSANSSASLVFGSVRFATKNNIAYIILGTDTTVHSYANIFITRCISGHTGFQQRFKDLPITFETDTSTWAIKQTAVFDKSIDNVTLGSVLTYENSWKTYGGTWGVYIEKLKDGTVFMEGLLYNGANNTRIGTLPSEYRPPRAMLFSATCEGGKSQRIDINVDGQLMVTNEGTRDDSNKWISLRCSYRTY